jgi:hypothetical protein
MTTDEEKELAELLKKLEPGFLPYDIFVEIARLVALPIIEFVPFRLNAQKKIEVLLLHRGDDDPIWPGAWHTPGTVIRATDNEDKIYKAFERILKDELKNTKVGQPYYVGSVFHKSKRGAEQSQVFWVEVLGNPEAGKFYELENLHQKTIKSQLLFIKQAAQSYAGYKRL